MGPVQGSIGFDLERDTGKLKSFLSSSVWTQPQEQHNLGNLKRIENSSFLAGCSGFRQEKVSTELGRKDWNRLRLGFVPGAPRGRAWLPNLETRRAALQQVEGSPLSIPGRRKEEPLSVDAVLSILPS